MIKWRLANSNKCRPFSWRIIGTNKHRILHKETVSRFLACSPPRDSACHKWYAVTSVCFHQRYYLSAEEPINETQSVSPSPLCFIGLLSQSQWLDLWYPDSVSKNTPVHFTRIKVHITVICRCIYITFSHPITSSSALLISYRRLAFVSNLLALVFPS